MDLKNSAVFAAYNNVSGISRGSAMSNNAASATKQQSFDFGDMVVDVVSDSTKTIARAEQVGAAALVDNASMEELVEAVNNAEITLKTVVAVRDRVINAYQDIIKMPI